MTYYYGQICNEGNSIGKVFLGTRMLYPHQGSNPFEFKKQHLIFTIAWVRESNWFSGV